MKVTCHQLLCPPIGSRHFSSVPSRTVFSRAAATRSLSFNCLFTRGSCQRELERKITSYWPASSLWCDPGFTLISTLKRWGKLRISRTRMDNPEQEVKRCSRKYAKTLTDQCRHPAMRYGGSKLDHDVILTYFNLLCRHYPKFLEGVRVFWICDGADQVCYNVSECVSLAAEKAGNAPNISSRSIGSTPDSSVSSGWGCSSTQSDWPASNFDLRVDRLDRA